MTTVITEVYEAFRSAGVDEEHARRAAEALNREPLLPDLATSGQLRETELRLLKEIEIVRKETKEMETRLVKETKEMETRLVKETKEMETRLVKEIKQQEINIKQVEVNLHKAITAQTRWMLGGIAVLGIIFKLADMIIGA